MSEFVGGVIAFRAEATEPTLGIAARLLLPNGYPCARPSSAPSRDAVSELVANSTTSISLDTDAVVA